jgi:uncharacterized membrane protein
VVLDFDGVGTADEVLTKLRGLQKEHLIDLEDACATRYRDACGTVSSLAMRKPAATMPTDGSRS